ncbi:inosine/xanthosine triphosphatase [Natrialbaceae archaeon AArc-T1-2]|uniref:inosine/xanthosine triphosphatase n=1 Tax=Natrialbaceae archaeon AArc-T1-2 TaxID=3053904 RepID=UPI00255AEABF|nr:inosine/xanthosine triphosphatase [Natrialbaceae archaeon AArc-T1-2]WIV68271.1 inosine/xanthosine triphosphatase [Natrialbaceae archaeon AArc-T1-2]
MELAVGSTNPTKADATARALERYEPTVTAVDVDSGVSDQPRSIAETIEGAETRARRALEAVDTVPASDGRAGPGVGAFGVGLEGGVAHLESTPGLFLIMWAAVTDGDRIERASGPSLRLPDRVAARIDGGEELGPVMADVFGADRTDEGAIGALTGGLVDRTRALEVAVASAFGPFVAAHLA